MGKELVLFPNQTHACVQRRIERAETKAAVSGYVDDFVKRERIP